MNVSKILNIIGFIISMLGSFLMFYYSSKVESRLFIYSKEESKIKHQKDVFKNKMMRFGIILLFIGFCFQLISIFF
ncbi:MAG: hypothetical protein ABI091_30560 [Ferruginibacter sp.]